MLIGGTGSDILKTNHKFPNLLVPCELHVSPYLSLKFIQLSESTITEGLVLDSHVPSARAYTLIDIFPEWDGK